MPDPEFARRAIWVFGANLLGIDGAGAARVAADEYGAKRGVANGRTGNAYAIPTMQRPGRDTLDLADLTAYVQEFLAYAELHRDDAFLVTRIACGIAGHTDESVAPLFAGAPPNCILAPAWRAILDGPVDANV